MLCLDTNGLKLLKILQIDIHPSIHLEYDGAALPTTCLPRAEPTPYLQALVEDKTMRAKER